MKHQNSTSHHTTEAETPTPKKTYFLVIPRTRRGLHQIVKDMGGRFDFPLRQWVLTIEPSKFPKYLEDYVYGTV